MLSPFDRELCEFLFFSLRSLPSISFFLSPLTPQTDSIGLLSLAPSSPSFPQILQNFESNKYHTIEQVHECLTNLFQSFLLYAFEGDQMYVKAEETLEWLNKWREKEVVGRKEERERQKRERMRGRKENRLVQKIECIYMMREEVENYYKIKRYGGTYHKEKGKEEENEDTYTFRLSEIRTSQYFALDR